MDLSRLGIFSFLNGWGTTTTPGRSMFICIIVHCSFLGGVMYNVVVLHSMDPTKKFILKSYPRFEDALNYASIHLKFASKLGLFLNVEEAVKE